MINKTRPYYIAQAAVIAAAYVALTVVFAPISFGAIQVRIAEALCILPLFTSAAIPGLFIGCLIGNFAGGAILIDILFGSIASLLGAYFGYRLRSNRWLVPIPSVIANTIIVPLVLKYGYGVDLPIVLSGLYILLGEIAGAYILGEILAAAMMKHDFFKNGKRE